MRTLTDPSTGELIEVMDSDTVGGEPYDYSTYRAATMTVGREHRAAIDACETAGKRKASAEAEYHKQLALAVGRLKPQHGATVAETMAKGEDGVSQAKENLHAAEAEERAAVQRVKLAEADRTSLLTMGSWSRKSEEWVQ